MSGFVISDSHLESLETNGFALFSTSPNPIALTKGAIKIGKALGAEHVGAYMLKANDGSGELAKHVEGIMLDPTRINKYFALGCITSATVGGATRVYDARQAAELLAAHAPQYSGVTIKYGSSSYPDQAAEHALVSHDPKYGDVIRYRSKVVSNEITGGLPADTTEDMMYETVDEIVDMALVTEHNWVPGDLLIVNNGMTLHSRQPYEGDRQMMRYRYDDPFNKTIQIGGME